MRKLRAFTLLELLFVMILTTLIIGIGYLTFSISANQLNSYKENSEKVSEAFLISMLLNKDFAKATGVLKTSDSLIFINSVNNPIRYFFTEEYILRKVSSIADTFYYGTQNRVEKFLNKPADANNGMVDEIYFEMKTDKERFEIFHAIKTYSAETLMQEDMNKILLK